MYFLLVFATKFDSQMTFATKIPLVTLDKSHAILITNDKRYWIKKIKNTSSSFDSIVYLLSHATTIQLFWSPLRLSDVLPNVSTFNYFKYKYHYYFEIIQNIQFKRLDDFIL